MRLRFESESVWRWRQPAGRDLIEFSAVPNWFGRSTSSASLQGIPPVQPSDSKTDGAGQGPAAVAPEQPCSPPAGESEKDTRASVPGSG